MASQLPDRLVDDITDFFLLDVLKEEDRKTLCLGAHFMTSSTIRSKNGAYSHI